MFDAHNHKTAMVKRLGLACSERLEELILEGLEAGGLTGGERVRLTVSVEEPVGERRREFVASWPAEQARLAQGREVTPLRRVAGA